VQRVQGSERHSRKGRRFSKCIKTLWYLSKLNRRYDDPCAVEVAGFGIRKLVNCLVNRLAIRSPHPHLPVCSEKTASEDSVPDREPCSIVVWQTFDSARNIEARANGPANELLRGIVQPPSNATICIVYAGGNRGQTTVKDEN